MPRICYYATPEGQQATTGSKVCYLTAPTKLLVKTNSCYLEHQTKKEARAKGQRKKTARVWDPFSKPLTPQP